MDESSGWRADPFGTHELRYFSQGSPTRLVRDQDQDSFDALTAAAPPPGSAPAPAPAPGSAPAPAPAPGSAPAPAPGWYVDPSDPGALRLWDGTKWTARQAPNAPSSSERVTSMPEPDQGAPEPPEPDQGAPEVVREPHAEVGEEVPGAGHTPDTLGRDGPVTPADTPPEDETGRDIKSWVEEAQRAMVRASTVGSEAAWRDMVHTAAVVLDVVTAIQALHDANAAVDEANRALYVSTDKADRATDAAQRATKVARDAAQAAEEAGLAAEAAERAAAAAARTARAATDSATKVDIAVAQARTANTADAWHEAAKVARDIVGDVVGDDEDEGEDASSPSA